MTGICREIERVTREHSWPSWLDSVVELNRTLGAMPLLPGNTATLLPDYAESIAAMAAAGRAQAGLSDIVMLSGATPVHVPDGVEAPWTDRDRHWPLGVRDAEEGLQDDLRRLLGVAEVKPVGLGPVLDAAGVVGRAVPEVGR